MADDQQPSIVVPEELKKKYPELISLILSSESMNDDERQYWVNILPIMTPEQVENLRQILQNEREQLNAIDSKYEKEMARAQPSRPIEDIRKERDERRRERRQSEGNHEEEERRKEEEILAAIDKLDA